MIDTLSPQAPLPPVIILNEPQMAENIGAVARVMANFGLYELRMVRPRDGWPQERAYPSASGANWPLDDAKVFLTMEEAVADLHRVYATTARPRETQLDILTPRTAAPKLFEAAVSGQRVGIMFGGERSGLETSDLAYAHGIITIPIDEKFRSLNLAQAVSICCYEWRVMVMDAPREAFHANLDVPASQDNVQRLFDHLEGELEAAGFFYPEDKKPTMVRNLRITLGRAHMTEQEVRTWRGVVTALTQGRGRVLAKMAEKRAKAEAEKLSKDE